MLINQLFTRTFQAIICLFGGFSLLAQVPFPDPGHVFRDDLIPVVKLFLPADSLATLYQNPSSNHEYPATFVFESGLIRDTMFNVGLRFRGNTSRGSGKKSFKVSFNTYNNRQSFFGLEKMNLNGEHNDPSIIRSKLTWDLYRMIGVPAPRSNHIYLYINDVFKGIYINVEQIDEEFADLRFGSKQGNLYKCLYPADLTYRGPYPGDYKFMSGSRRAYALKTNESADDYSDLATFITKLNRTPDNQFRAEIESVLNVGTLLKIMVVDVFTGNWDGPFYNKNNFYLYHNPLTGKFELIPYDVDNTFGIDWFNVDWAQRNIYAWPPAGQDRPLFTRILAVAAYRAEYTRLFRAFLDQVSSGDYLVQHAITLRDGYASRVSQDPFYKLDYGWEVADFTKSFNNRLSAGHVKYGLIPFIYARIESARQQLDPVSGLNEITSTANIRMYPNPASDFLIVEGATGFESWSLTNTSGQPILSGKTELSQSFSISISTLPPGIYFLSLTRKPATGNWQPAIQYWPASEPAKPATRKILVTR